MIGTNITAAQNITARVRWLETLSQTKRLDFGSVEEGIMNGNIETPAVPIIPAIIKEVKIKPTPGRLIFPKRIATNPATKPSAGTAILIGMIE